MLNPASTIKTANGVDRRGAGSQESLPNLRSRIEQVIIICQGHRPSLDDDGHAAALACEILGAATVNLGDAVQQFSNRRFPPSWSDLCL
jgi:hypothetical protein